MLPAAKDIVSRTLKTITLEALIGILSDYHDVTEYEEKVYYVNLYIESGVIAPFGDKTNLSLLRCIRGTR